MNFFKAINLTAYHVEYIDQREPKPRTTYKETVVLDGSRISALNRLDIRPAGYITQQYANHGFVVTNISKGETLTTEVDLTKLWQNTTPNHNKENTQNG